MHTSSTLFYFQRSILRCRISPSKSDHHYSHCWKLSKHFNVFSSWSQTCFRWRLLKNTFNTNIHRYWIAVDTGVSLIVSEPILCCGMPRILVRAYESCPNTNQIITKHSMHATVVCKLFIAHHMQSFLNVPRLFRTSKLSWWTGLLAS